MVTVSRAPLGKVEAYKRRMEWSLQWVSSLETDFNSGYDVTFTEDEIKNGGSYYNFGTIKAHGQESPGISVFCTDDDGNIFHTYSCYACGLAMLNGAYHFLDLLPKGRDESGLHFSTSWLRRHDKYDQSLPRT